MARVLVALVVLLLLLNGMTFLLVVNQGGGTDKAQAATTSQPRPASGSDAGALKLDQISQSLQTVHKSISDLSRKLEDLGRKVAAQNVARSIPAPTPQPQPLQPNNTAKLPAASAGANTARLGAGRPIPAIRRGPTELSATGTAPAPAVPDPEMEDDNAADHAPPRGTAVPRLETPSGEPVEEGATGEEPVTPAPTENGGTETPADPAEETGQE